MSYLEENRKSPNTIRMGTILRNIMDKGEIRNDFVFLSRDEDNAHVVYETSGSMTTKTVSYKALKDSSIYEVTGQVDLMKVIRSGLQSVKNAGEKRRVRRLVQLELQEDCDEGEAGKMFVLHVYDMELNATLEEIEEYIKTIYLFDMTRWAIDEVRIVE